MMIISHQTTQDGPNPPTNNNTCTVDTKVTLNQGPLWGCARRVYWGRVRAMLHRGFGHNIASLACAQVDGDSAVWQNLSFVSVVGKHFAP